MKIKLLEIRDRGTRINAIAIELFPRDSRDRYILDHAGYGTPYEGMDDPYILFGSIEGGRPLEYDAFKWTNRTMHWAHMHLKKNWNNINNGDVIDVEFTQGITAQPKISEEFTV